MGCMHMLSIEQDVTDTYSRNGGCHNMRDGVCDSMGLSHT